MPAAAGWDESVTCATGGWAGVIQAVPGYVQVRVSTVQLPQGSYSTYAGLALKCVGEELAG